MGKANKIIIKKPTDWPFYIQPIEVYYLHDSVYSFIIAIRTAYIIIKMETFKLIRRFMTIMNNKKKNEIISFSINYNYYYRLHYILSEMWLLIARHASYKLLTICFYVTRSHCMNLEKIVNKWMERRIEDKAKKKITNNTYKHTIWNNI